MPADRARRLVLLAILLLCVVSRGGYVLYVAHVNPDLAFEPDTASYADSAEALVEHHRFDDAADDRTPEFVRTPGYPLFLASVREVFGSSVTPVLLVQVLLSAMTVFLAFVLATRMWSVDTGLVAAALVALEPLQFSTTGTLLTECLSALLLMLVVLLGFALLTAKHRRVLLASGLGLALAAATMVRPLTYYLPLFGGALLVTGLVREGVNPRRGAVIVAAFVLPLVLIVGGWQLRNHERVDSWRLSGVEGKNIYQWRAAGVVAERDGITLEEARRRLKARFGPIGDESEGAYYGRQYREGLAILRAHPVETLEVTVHGLWDELFHVRGKVARYLRIAPLSGPSAAIALALLVGFYLAAAFGLIRVIGARRALFAHAFVVGTALYVLVASAGPEAFGTRGERFRAPVMPIVALYAAHGAMELSARRGRGASAEGDAPASPPDSRVRRTPT